MAIIACDCTGCEIFASGHFRLRWDDRYKGLGFILGQNMRRKGRGQKEDIMDKTTKAVLKAVGFAVAAIAVLVILFNSFYTIKEQ